MVKIIATLLILYLYVGIATAASPNLKDDIGNIKSNVGSLSSTTTDDPINNLDFSADNIEYNFKDNIVIATGNVTFRSDNQILIADRIFYSAKYNIIFAEGNVYFQDKSGNNFYSSYLEVDSELHAGILKDFEIIFKDGATLSSHFIEKTNADKYGISKPCYTNCKTEDNKTPTWQIKASKGIYNPTEETISFYNTWLEVKGVPVVWSPFLHFSNLQFKRKIGFLTPEIKNTSTYGSALLIPFYVPIGDHQDLTITPYVSISKTSNRPHNAPILYTAAYNGYIQNGKFKMNSSYATNEITGQDNWHYFLNLNVDLTDYVRTSVRVEETSRNQYLDQYNINPKDSSESFLVNNMLFEGFIDNNSYTQFGGYSYNYINPTFTKSNPYTEDVTFKHIYFSDYGKLGRLNITGVGSQYFFSNNDTVTRGVINANHTYYTSTFLGNYTTDTTFQAVEYYVNDTNSTTTNTGYSAAAVSITWDYTLLSLLDYGTLSFTPLLQFSLSTYLNDNDNISLVDSFTTNTTVNNLFDTNHYSGYDVFENTQNIKYGLEASFVTLDNKGSRLFVGQIQTDNYLSKIFRDNKYFTTYSSSVNQSKSNYYLAADIFFGGFYLTYEGILDLSYKNIEDTVVVGYSNALFGTQIQHSAYNGLDTEIAAFANVAEIIYSGYINLNKNLSFKFSLTYGSNTNVNTSLRSNHLSLIWADDCLEFMGYIRKDYYDSSVNTYGVKLKISSIN